MKIVKITYMERRNLGNYEHAEITTEAEVSEGEIAERVLEEVKSFTRDGLYGPEQLPLTPVAPVEQKEEEVKKEEKKPKKKKKKTEGTPYSREDQVHKKLFVGILDAQFPGWKANQEKAKTISISLSGEEFLSESGEVLQSFKDKLVEEFNK